MEIKLNKEAADWLGWAMLEGNIISHEQGFEFKDRTLKIDVIPKEMYSELRYRLVDKRFRRSKANKDVALDLFLALQDYDILKCDKCGGPGAKTTNRSLQKNAWICPSCMPQPAAV